MALQGRKKKENKNNKYYKKIWESLEKEHLEEIVLNPDTNTDTLIAIFKYADQEHIAYLAELALVWRDPKPKCKDTTRNKNR